ncbi:hypothetical protein [Pseudophaeobacter sp.]|uniref:hypothetical protein n=1 Tax=Pseudophaeobacter sp. TaxID=1971739 RepID=UPI004058A4B2
MKPARANWRQGILMVAITLGLMVQSRAGSGGPGSAAGPEAWGLATQRHEGCGGTGTDLRPATGLL